MSMSMNSSYSETTLFRNYIIAWIGTILYISFYFRLWILCLILYNERLKGVIEK